MSMRKVERIASIRGDAKCRQCGADIRELLRQGKAVYSEKSGKSKNRYLCAECKAELFGGVKLRKAEGSMGEIKKKGKRVILSTGPAREEDFEDTDSDVDRLYEWVVENGLQEDPRRISKIHDEARRRWPKLITRRISEIVEGTLRKEAED